MMKKLIICAAVLLALVLLYQLSPFGKGLTLTAGAVVHIPTEDAYYVRENGGYKDTWIRPDGAAYLSSGEHGAPYHPILCRNGVIVTGLGYGPTSVKGTFSAARLLKAWPALPLENDWEFGLGLFNTSDGKRVHAYLDLEIYADSLTAKATLYLYYEGYAHPVIREWTGAVGEPVGFGAEI